MNDSALTQDDIRSALQEVIDPEVGVNVLDLGLIYEVWVGGDTVRIKMTMTTPACPMGSYLTDNVKSAVLRRLPSITQVEVELVWEPPWDPAMISDEAKRQLGWEGR